MTERTDNEHAGESHEELRAFAAETLGPIQKVEDRSRQYGRKSITWKVTVDGGDAFYLKRHEERRLYETEIVAYTKWVPRIRDSSEWRFPELVGNSPKLGALLLTEVLGAVLEGSPSNKDDRIRMHRSAGRLAAQIHQLDVDASEAGPARLYGLEIWERNFLAAVPYLDPDTLRWIEEIAAEKDPFHGLAVVPTHSDFSPRNWLIDRQGGNVVPGLIDWERARPGYWLEDAERLVFDHWQKDPQLRTEFFDGYGRTPSPIEERQLNLICLANALATVSWATEHGDLKFAEFGKRVVGLLRQQFS